MESSERELTLLCLLFVVNDDDDDGIDLDDEEFTPPEEETVSACPTATGIVRYWGYFLNATLAKKQSMSTRRTNRVFGAGLEFDNDENDNDTNDDDEGFSTAAAAAEAPADDADDGFTVADDAAATEEGLMRC